MNLPPIGTREQILLAGLDLAGQIGAEIGPLHRALVAKQAGRVFYVDHCDTESLRERWASDPNVDITKLHVDAVWGANSLREALNAAPPLADGTSPQRPMHYVIASHVVEHVPDLIGWLREINEVLVHPWGRNRSGTLRLAVPDKRYTFDRLRHTTQISEVLEAFALHRRVPAASRVLDFALHMSTVDVQQAWRGTLDEACLVHGYTLEQALALARDAELNHTYHDVHCWVFTPRSFASLCAELARLQLLELGCEWITDTAPDTFEFFASMRPMASHEEVARSWQAGLRSLAP